MKIKNCTDIIKKFLSLKKSVKNISFLHSGQKGKSLLAYNPVAKFSGSNLDLFRKFTETYNDCLLVGYISYNLAYSLYKIKPRAKNDLKLPEICFHAYENWHESKNTKEPLKNDEMQGNEETLTELYDLYSEGRDDEVDEAVRVFQRFPKRTKIPEIRKGPGKSENFKVQISKKDYFQAFNDIKEYIRKGEVYQLNLTHRLEAKSSISAKDLFIRIVRSNPVNYLAYLENDEFEILSASPENFIKIKNGKIETNPVKGTRPRGKTSMQDKKLARELLKSPKEAAELNMITDLLRNDLNKVCKTGTVKVTKFRALQKCPKVWHTYSTINGELATTPIEALLSMLPGGSITGCPKKRAIEIIDELEPNQRGIYTGVIGYITPRQKKLDFSIAIRTIIKKGAKLYLQVGGGIVIDSGQAQEYQETLDKAKSFMNILA